MKYYIFLDDSGQLHKNYPQGNYFVYGGLLIKESDIHGINQSYRKFVRRLKRDHKIDGELKTIHMNIGTRRRALKRLAKYSCEQIFVSVHTQNIVRLDFDNKHNVVRFKNYVVRRLVDQLIKDHKIPRRCEVLEVHIDNQNVAHSSLDSLENHLVNYFNEENYLHVDRQFDENSFRTDIKVNIRIQKRVI